MRHPLAPLSALVLLSLVAADVCSQPAASTRDRIHWYLAHELDRARPTDQLPVYFVMADQLGHDHWFPRLHRLSIDRRRAIVMAELEDHATRTQRPLMDQLRAAEDAGLVSGIRSIWLGNFVKCRATPLIVRSLARLPGVREVRYVAAWPLDQIQDGSPPTEGGGTPGTGPINTHAVKVWALGFMGQGVIAMNADTVAAINHGDLVNRKWTNPGEIPGNGIDDDQNGYVDDINGYNFFDDNNNISSGSLSHGTMTAGCMVADGACSGIVTGEAPAARVMYGAIGGCCPQTGPVNPGGEVAQWEAIQYAIQNGAHIQTSSHSYKNGFVPPPDYEMHRIVGDNSLAAGLIRCNSTSNNGAEANNPTHPARIPFNISAPGNIPPPYLDPAQQLVGQKSGVIGVGAHDRISNQLVSYSPRGPFAWHLEDVLAVNPSYPVAHWNAAMNDYPWWSGRRQGLLKPDVTGPTETLSLVGTACGTGNSNGTSNATPRVAGAMILWKCANMSLGPEDMAMIVHQSAVDIGNVPGKENNYGAGRVDALAGLFMALCVHRANGEPAWSITHRAGTPLTLEVDTLPGCVTVIAALAGRNGPPLPNVFFAGPTGPTGDVSVTVPTAASAAGTVMYTRAITACDRHGVVDRTLKSNVIEIRLVP